jgi:hypothetical protein
MTTHAANMAPNNLIQRQYNLMLGLDLGSFKAPAMGMTDVTSPRHSLEFIERHAASRPGHRQDSSYSAKI